MIIIVISNICVVCVSAEVCSVDCGTHGVCMGGSCRCEEGWTGEACDQRVCSPLCVKHGTCKDGKCECNQGWNGEHCTIGRSMARASLFSSIHSCSLLVSCSFKAIKGSLLFTTKDTQINYRTDFSHETSNLSTCLMQLIISIRSLLWQGHGKENVFFQI